MAAEGIEPIERWTAQRRVALVVSIVKGEPSVAEAARTQDAFFIPALPGGALKCRFS